MRLTYSTVAAVLLPASLVRLIRSAMPVISKFSDSRSKAAAGPGWGLLHPSEPSFQIDAPFERLASLGDRRSCFEVHIELL
jgi:hypothetical protein